VFDIFYNRPKWLTEPLSLNLSARASEGEWYDTGVTALHLSITLGAFYFDHLRLHAAEQN
jgi:hypothetical protein